MITEVTAFTLAELFHILLILIVNDKQLQEQGFECNQLML